MSHRLHSWLLPELSRRAEWIAAEVQRQTPRRAGLAAGVDFRPLIDHGAGDIALDLGVRDPYVQRPTPEPPVPQPVRWPAPWLPCPGCGLNGWHLLLHRPSLPGVVASWPDPAAPAWERTCCYCGHEWLEPAADGP